MTLDPTSVEACLARMKADEAKLQPMTDAERLELLDLGELEDEELEAIVRAAKTGGNELMQTEARQAEAILQNRAERAWEREQERLMAGGSSFAADYQHNQAEARKFK